MPGPFYPPPRFSDPDMYHGTSMTHVPWCMLGSLTVVSFEDGVGENVPDIPCACTTRNFAYLVRGPWGNNLLVGGFARQGYSVHNWIKRKVLDILYYKQQPATAGKSVALQKRLSYLLERSEFHIELFKKKRRWGVGICVWVVEEWPGALRRRKL